MEDQEKHPSVSQGSALYGLAAKGLGMVVLPLLCNSSCSDRALSPPSASGPAIEIIAPERIGANEYLPVVVRALNRDGGTDTRLDWVSQIAAGDQMEPLSLKKGAGAAMVFSSGGANLDLVLVGADGTRRVSFVDSIEVEHYAGRMEPGRHVWDRSRDRYITRDLTVPPGAELIIEEGTRIVFGPRANILVEGQLRALGTQARPILYMPADWKRPWGGVEVVDGQAEFTQCFFVNGGADPNKTFGHSDSQPVVMGHSAEVSLTSCYFLDNPGKALGASRSRFRVHGCLITRCDTGGEFTESLALISSSHVLDIPNGDDVFADDDNDGFYFSSTYPGSNLPSIVRDTFVIKGKDDAIDHNNARLEIQNCWLEGFAHEGVAGSNGNWVKIFNTVVRGCDQGIEAGYGEPQVFVDHCVVVENGVGLRFGDSYDWGSAGRLIVSNSIIHNNANNILNFDLKTAQAVKDGILVSYSLVPSAPAAAAAPQFDEAYHLLPSSPGKGAAADGTDIGLLSPQ